VYPPSTSSKTLNRSNSTAVIRETVVPKSLPDSHSFLRQDKLVSLEPKDLEVEKSYRVKFFPTKQKRILPTEEKN